MWRGCREEWRPAIRGSGTAPEPSSVEATRYFEQQVLRKRPLSEL